MSIRATMTDKIAIKRRKRGVKASRVKLEKALINAGFTTQAALAKHIAEVEGTDSIPKDIVNRVFREVSVSPTYFRACSQCTRC